MDVMRLNPYYTGRYSLRNYVTISKIENGKVLILIILEDTL